MYTARIRDGCQRQATFLLLTIVPVPAFIFFNAGYVYVYQSLILQQLQHVPRRPVAVLECKQTPTLQTVICVPALAAKVGVWAGGCAGVCHTAACSASEILQGDIRGR